MPTTRRDFLKGTVAAAAFSGAALSNFMTEAAAKEKVGSRIWGNLLHLGHNMWGDTPRAYTPPSFKLDCEDALWVELTERCAEAGLNMIVIDLGEGIRYESHPELAVEGAWSIEKLRKDLARLRGLGLEPIPKLNFSACHDFWLGEYSRMLSTSKYYEVCADLIREVCAIFDTPRFFHLGYDEETAEHQRTYDYVVIRQGELWWHDFLWFVGQVEEQKVRPWIWSDFCWKHKEDFLKRMPKSVLQSNWYYGNAFEAPHNVYVQTYLDLDKAGFDQVPTASNWSNNVNFKMTVEFCKENISEQLLKGFLQTPWKFTQSSVRDHHLRAIEQVKEMIY
ncbi:MAG: twin-arginine translocation signal domain-containing protein [Planctomycetia bacterium]|nr:twin-arginine translocation signal domain-containing protein [Planctomycetia bacterium]